jgi:plasmid maintenance system antidote protein VapI
MDTLDLIDAKRNSFTVPEFRKMLGICKTESYWILKHRNIETVKINGQIRILKSSFEEWYSNQTRYHIIGGPEPGDKLKENSYSPKDLMRILGISEYVAYTLISRGCFETFTVDYNIRISRESFNRWYASQEKYRSEEDHKQDLPTLATTYSLPDIRHLLGVHRNTVYYIVEHHKDVLEVLTIAGQKRITISSFERWYNSQSRYKLKESHTIDTATDNLDISAETVENTAEATEAPEAPEYPAEKEIYRLEDLMGMLKITRKAAYKLIQSGELLAIKAGKAYLIPASEYERYRERSKNSGIDHTEK